MSRHPLLVKPIYSRRAMRALVTLIVTGVLLGDSSGCGFNEPVMATGTGLKTKLKNREEREIKSRRVMYRTSKGRS
jgi:hypothetical protein